MRARHRRKDQDQHDQHRAGGDRIGEQRERDVSAASFSAMMPEPTIAASRKALPIQFGDKAAQIAHADSRTVAPSIRPIWRSFV